MDTRQRTRGSSDESEWSAGAGGGRETVRIPEASACMLWLCGGRGRRVVRADLEVAAQQSVAANALAAQCEPEVVTAHHAASALALCVLYASSAYACTCVLCSSDPVSCSMSLSN